MRLNLFSVISRLIIFFLLGILAGLVSLAFVKMIRLCEFTFEHIPVPDWVKPGIGGLILGAMALKIPAVLGVGYEAVNMGLTGVLPLDLAFYY